MADNINFHDMPGNINMENGVLHLDFYDRAVSTSGLGDAQYVFGRRLVLTLPAFLRLYEMMGDVIAKLDAAGLVTISEKTPEGSQSPTPGA